MYIVPSTFIQYTIGYWMGGISMDSKFKAGSWAVKSIGTDYGE